MRDFCQCPYETASRQVCDGKLNGVLVCAVCELPKRREIPDGLFSISQAAALVGIGAKTLRTLISSGSVQPTHRDGRQTLVRPAHLLAQLSQKGIRK